MSAAYANGHGRQIRAKGYEGPTYAPPPARGVPASLIANSLNTEVTDEEISKQFEEDRINRLKDQRAELQRKVFTKWVNSQFRLNGRQHAVRDLFEDVKDGRLLMELLSCLTGQPLKPNPGILRVQKAENVNRCLQIIEDQLNDKLVNIGAVDIVDGNRIAILGLIWTIILRFQIQAATEGPGEVAEFHEQIKANDVESSIRPHIAQGQQAAVGSAGYLPGTRHDREPGTKMRPSADAGGHLRPEKVKEMQRIEEALLMWARSKCARYNIDVTNFSTSWRDGQAFCALIHSQCGDEAIDMSRVGPGANKENLDYAFSAAQELGVPRLLDPEDVDVRHPDSRLVLTYVTQLYHVLAKRQGEQIGGRRVAKIVSTLMRIDALKAQYLADVQELRSWLKDTEAKLNDRNFPSDTAKLQRYLNNFKDLYLAVEKPKKMNERDRVEAELVVIHTMQAGLNTQWRWIPPAGYSISEMGADWDRLMEAEHSRQSALHAALQQAKRFEIMVSQFNRYADICSEWLKSMSGKLASEKTPLDDRSAELLLKRYETEIFGVENRFEVLTQLVENFTQEGFEGADVARDRLEDLLRRRDALRIDVNRRLEAASLFRNVLGMLTQLRTVAKELNTVQEACQSTNYGQHLLEVAELLEQHNNVNTDLKSVGHVLSDIGEQLRELREEHVASNDNVAPNIESAIRELEDVEKIYELSKGLVEARQQALLLSQQYHHLVDDCREETAWLREKQMQFESMEIGRDLTQAQAQARKFDVIQGELSARWARTEKLLSSGGRLTETPASSISPNGSRPTPQPQPTADIKLLSDRLLAEWERVRQRAVDRRKLLDTSVKLHKLVSDMEEAGSWLSEKEQVLSNRDCGEDSLSAAALLRRCLQTRDEIVSFEDRLKKLNANVQLALNTAKTENTTDAIPIVEKVVVLYSYSGKNFNAKKGDVLELIHRSNKDWWLARRMSDGRQGYVPANYVRLNPAETMDSQLTLLNDRFMRLRATADQRERDLLEATRYYEYLDSCDQMLNWIATKSHEIADFAATKLPTPSPAEVGHHGGRRSSRSQLLNKSVAKEMVDFQKTLSASFTAQSSRLNEIRTTAEVMLDENHPQSPDITDLKNRVELAWTDLQQIKLEFEQRAQGMSNLELFEQTVNEALELINRRLSNWTEQMDQCEDPIRQDFFFQNEINITEERIAKAESLAKAVAESYPEEASVVRRRLKQLHDAWSQLKIKKDQWQERIELLNSRREFEDESVAVNRWLDRTISRLEADAKLNTVAMTTEERANQVAELESEMHQWIGRIENVIALGVRAEAAGDVEAGETAQKIHDKRCELADLAGQFELNVEQQQAREKFLKDANNIDSKLKEYETVLSVDDYGESIDGAEKIYKRTKEDIELKLEPLIEKVRHLDKTSKELAANEHPDAAQFVAISHSVKESYNRVTKACEDRLQLLTESLKMHQWLADSEDFIEWCEEKLRLIPTDASDLINDLDCIDKRNTKHATIESDVHRNEAKKKDLVAAGKVRLEIAEDEFPASKQEAVEDCLMQLNTVWEDLLNATARRREVLDSYLHDRKLQHTLITSEMRLQLAEKRLANGEEIGPTSAVDNLRSASRALQRHSNYANEVNEDIIYLNSIRQVQQHQGRLSQSENLPPAISAQIDDLLKRYEDLKNPSSGMKRKLEIQKAYYELLIELKNELAWIKVRKTIVDNDRQGSSLWEAQSLLKKFRQVDLDLKGHEQLLDRLLAKSNEVVAETEKDPAPIYELVDEVKHNWEKLKSAADKRRRMLEDVLAVQQCLAEVDEFEQWLRDAEKAVYSVEDQNEVITVNSDAIERQLRRQQRQAKELEVRSYQLSKLMDTVKPLSEMATMAHDLPKRLQNINDSLLRLHERVDKAGAKLDASRLYYAWIGEISEFSEWIRLNMHLATSQDYGHDCESLKALEDKFDEFFRIVETRSEHFDEICSLSETLIKRLREVGNQHLVEQVNQRKSELGETWQAMLGHCARRRSNFEAARILHQFHQDLDDIHALINEKRAQVGTELGRDLQSVGRLIRQHDVLFDEVRSVEVKVDEILKTGEILQRQFPGPNAENIKDRCFETEEKIKYLTSEIEKRANELDHMEHYFGFMAQSKRAMQAVDDLIRELDSLATFNELDLVDQLIKEISVKGKVHTVDLEGNIKRGHELIETRASQFHREIEKRIRDLEEMKRLYESTLKYKRDETDKALAKRIYERKLLEISEKAIDLANRINRMSCSETARTGASTSSLVAATAVAGGDPLRAAELRLNEADTSCKSFDQQLDEVVEQIKHIKELDRAVGETSKHVLHVHKSVEAKRSELDQALAYRELNYEAADLESWLESKIALLRRAAQELERGSHVADAPAHDDIEDRISYLRRFQSVENEMRQHEAQYQRVMQLAESVISGIDAALSQGAQDFAHRVQHEWQTLIDLLSRQTEALNNYRLLLQFLELCQSVEAWVADREILVLAGDLGRDYEHCRELQERIQTEADMAGNLQRNQGEVSSKIRDINSLQAQLVTKPEIANYVEQKVLKINARWAELEQMRTEYLILLNKAVKAHEFVLDCDQLISQLQKIESQCSSDISNCDQSELEWLHREQNAVEREMSIVQNMIERQEGREIRLSKDCPPLADIILSRNKQVCDMLDHVSEICNKRQLELSSMLKVNDYLSRIIKITDFASRTITEMQQVVSPKSTLEAQSIVEQHAQRNSEVENRQREVELVLQGAEELSRERPASRHVSRKFHELQPACDRLRRIWTDLIEEINQREELFDQHLHYQVFLQLEYVADQWIESKIHLPSDLGSSIGTADFLLQDHNKLMNTMKAQSTKINDLIEHYETKITSDHFAFEELQGRITRITEKNNRLVEACQNRLKLLEDSRRFHRWMTLSGDMLDWISDRLEALDDAPKTGRPSFALTDLGGVSARLRYQIGIESEMASNRELHETLIRRGMVLTGGEIGTSISARMLHSNSMVVDVERRCHELKHSWDALEDAIQGRREMLEDAKEISALQAKCDRLVQWAQRIEDQLSQEDYRMLDDMDAVEMKQRLHEALQDSLELRRNQLFEMAERARELSSKSHGLGKDVAVAVLEVDQRVRALDEPMTIHRNNLLDAYELCKLSRDIARELVWVGDRAVAAASGNFGDNLAHVVTLKKAHEKLVLEIDAHSNAIEEIGKRAEILLARQREAAADVRQRYEQLIDALNNLRQLAEDRLNQLEEAMQSHRFYAELKESMDWIAIKGHTLADIVGRLAEDNVHDVAGQLDLINQETSEYASTIEDVEKLAIALISRRHLDSSNIEDQKDKLIRAYSTLRANVEQRVDEVENWRRLFSVRRQLRDACRQTADWLSELQSEDFGRDLEQCESILADSQQLFQEIEVGGARMDELCRQAAEFEALEDVNLLQQLGTLGQLRASIQEWIEQRKMMLENARAIHMFLREGDNTIAWIADKEPSVFSKDLGHNLETVQRLLQKHVSIERDLQALSNRMESLHRNAEELSKSFGQAQSRIADKYTTAANLWSGLVQQWQKRKDDLDRALSLQKFLANFQAVVGWFMSAYKLMTVEQTPGDIEALKVLMMQHSEYKTEFESHQDATDKLFASGEELLSSGISEDESRLVHHKLESIREVLVQFIETWRRRRLEYESRYDLLMHSYDLNEVDRWVAEHDPGKKEGRARQPEAINEIEEELATLAEVESSIKVMDQKVATVARHRTPQEIIADRAREAQNRRRFQELLKSEEERVTRDRRKRDERRRTGEVTPAMVAAAKQLNRQSEMSSTDQSISAAAVRPKSQPMQAYLGSPGIQPVPIAIQQQMQQQPMIDFDSSPMVSQILTPDPEMAQAQVNATPQPLVPVPQQVQEMRADRPSDKKHPEAHKPAEARKSFLSVLTSPFTSLSSKHHSKHRQHGQEYQQEQSPRNTKEISRPVNGSSYLENGSFYPESAHPYVQGGYSYPPPQQHPNLQSLPNVGSQRPQEPPHQSHKSPLFIPEATEQLVYSPEVHEQLSYDQPQQPVFNGGQPRQSLLYTEPHQQSMFNVEPHQQPMFNTEPPQQQIFVNKPPQQMLQRAPLRFSNGVEEKEQPQTVEKEPKAVGGDSYSPPHAAPPPPPSHEEPREQHVDNFSPLAPVHSNISPVPPQQPVVPVIVEESQSYRFQPSPPVPPPQTQQPQPPYEEQQQLPPPQPEQEKRRLSVSFRETVTEILPSDEEKTSGAQPLKLKPQGKAYKPKLDIPVQYSGYLHRRHCKQPGGRPATRPKWIEMYVVLSGQLLSFYSSKSKFEALDPCATPVSVAGARCAPSQNFAKRTNIFTLTLTDKSEYMFSARDNFKVLDWVSRIEHYASIDPRYQLDEYQPHFRSEPKKLPSLPPAPSSPVKALAQPEIPVDIPSTSFRYQSSPPERDIPIKHKSPSPKPKSPSPKPPPTRAVSLNVQLVENTREPSPVHVQYSPARAPSPVASVTDTKSSISPSPQPPEVRHASPQQVELDPEPEDIPMPELSHSPRRKSPSRSPELEAEYEQQIVVADSSQLMPPPVAPPPALSHSEEQQPANDAYKNLLEQEEQEEQVVEPEEVEDFSNSLMAFGVSRHKAQDPDESPDEDPFETVKGHDESLPTRQSPKLMTSILDDEIEEYENFESVPRARRAGSNSSAGNAPVADVPSAPQQPFSPIGENQAETSVEEKVSKPLTVEVATAEQPIRSAGSVRRRRPSFEVAAGNDESLIGAFDRDPAEEPLNRSNVIKDDLPPPTIEPLAASPRSSRIRDEESPQMSPSGTFPRQGSLPPSQKKNRLLDKIGGSFKFKKHK